MPFYIDSGFRATVVSWIARKSAPNKTYYLGLRTDTPTASDNMGAVQEIGTASPMGYARAVFLAGQILMSFDAQNYVTFQTVTGVNNPSRPHFPVMGGPPSPNSATHWFLTDQPDSSGTLLVSGPIADGCIEYFNGYTAAPDGSSVTAINSGEVVGDSAIWRLTQAVAAGQKTLSAKSSAGNTAQIGDYFRLATGYPGDQTGAGEAPAGYPFTNSEIVHVVSAQTVSGVTTLGLSQPLMLGHPVSDLMLGAMTTRVYADGFQESLQFTFYNEASNYLSSPYLTMNTSAGPTPAPSGGGGGGPSPPTVNPRQDNFLAVLARLDGAYHRASPSGTLASPTGLSIWRADAGQLPTWSLANSPITTRPTCAGPSLALTSRNRLICGMVDSGTGTYAAGGYDAYSDNDGADWSQPVMSIPNARYYRVRAGRDGGIMRLGWIDDGKKATPPTGNLWAQYQSSGDDAPSALVKLTDQSGKVISVSDAAPDLDQVSAAGSPWRMSALEVGSATPTEFFSWHETDPAWLRINE